MSLESERKREILVVFTLVCPAVLEWVSNVSEVIRRTPTESTFLKKSEIQIFIS